MQRSIFWERNWILTGCPTTIELEKAARGEVVDPKVVQAIAQELVRARKKLSTIHEEAIRKVIEEGR